MSESIRIFQPEDVPGEVAAAIRRLQSKHPEYQARIRKRMAQQIPLSLSFIDKLVCGQHKRLDSAHLLNANSFFNHLLIPEIQGEELGETERRELIDLARRIERLAGKWSF